MYKHALRDHHQSLHGDIRFPCDQCDFVAARERALLAHKRSHHKGIRSPSEIEGVGLSSVKNDEKAWLNIL